MSAFISLFLIIGLMVAIVTIIQPFRRSMTTTIFVVITTILLMLGMFDPVLNAVGLPNMSIQNLANEINAVNKSSINNLKVPQFPGTQVINTTPTNVTPVVKDIEVQDVFNQRLKEFYNIS